MDKNLQSTRRITDFATMLRNKTDKEVMEMLKSGEIRKYGLPWSVADMIFASRLHCKAEDIRLYRTDKVNTF